MNPHPFSEDASHSAPTGPAQPPRPAVRLGQIWPAGHFGRLAETVSVSWRRIWRNPIGVHERVWTRELTWLAAGGAVIVLLLFTVDARVMDFMLSNRGRLTGWLAEASQAGKSEWYLVPALLVYLVTATADWRNSGYRVRARLVSWFGQAAFLFGAVAITGIAVNVVKIVIGRARPSMFGEFGAYHFDPFVVSKYFSSFPSGHSTTLGALAAVLMIWSPRQWLPIGVVCLVLSAFRVPAIAHYPSDVLAGFLFAFVLTVVMARFLAARRVGFRPRPGKMLPAAMGMRQGRLPVAGA
ncbi:phosphatase PAP2 family protein [Aminobacter aganoensis]|nr:phosphatase PAP2 family protein [Aminobacter aganoensis]KQU65756.1 hypothetical protein ASC75_11135 [Aminobacter sp. DSM 101952]